jgi:hypothetical protein
VRSELADINPDHCEGAVEPHEHPRSHLTDRATRVIAQGGFSSLGASYGQGGPSGTRVRVGATAPSHSADYDGNSTAVPRISARQCQLSWPNRTICPRQDARLVVGRAVEPRPPLGLPRGSVVLK